jgi:hypothetical protein
MMGSDIMRAIGMEATDGSSTIIIGIVITSVISVTTGTIIRAKMSTTIIASADREISFL